MVALYRSGPMAEFPRFIAGKNNPKSITYPHPSLEPVLRDTYGVMVFQEQIIALLQLLAGYSPGEADLVRKAIGKKKRDIMEAEHPRFIKGCQKQGLNKAEAENIWKLIQPFADYSFNKAHAACYALIAYQTAYLKAHYPAAFMAALMTSDYDDTDRLAIEITECKKIGIDVLPPDVNESFHEFAIVPGENKIRFGMDAIKNVGHGAVEEILRAREEVGKFESLEDFCKNVNASIVNRKGLESLVKAGAFDAFSERSRLINNIDNILSFAARLQKDSRSGQVDLFGENAGAGRMVAKISWDDNGLLHNLNEQLSWERDLLGLYLSHHPLESYADYLEKNTKAINELQDGMEGQTVILGGAINSIREITTKNGSKMAFVKIADLQGEIELVIFPKVYLQSAETLQRDQVIVAKGKLSSGRGNNRGDSELKLLADEIAVVDLESPGTLKSSKNTETVVNKKNKTAAMGANNTDTLISITKQRLYIRLEDSSNQPILVTLKEKLESYSGETEVILVTGPSASKQIIKLPQAIDVNEESLRDLASVFGALNVVVR
jgi:DNA polymerase-3 subunit alpha